MAVCVKCLQNASHEEFSIGLLCKSPSSTCNDCKRKDAAERQRIYRERNKAAINARLAAKRTAAKKGPP